MKIISKKTFVRNLLKQFVMDAGYSDAMIIKDLSQFYPNITSIKWEKYGDINEDDSWRNIHTIIIHYDNGKIDKESL